MNIAIVAPNTNVKSWEKQFNLNSSTYDDIDCVCLWKHPKGILNKFKNIKLIYSMGAGVDHIINDDSLPNNVPVCRISDKKLSFSMTNYIITAVMFYHRRLLKYNLDKKNKLWDNETPPEIPIKIGNSRSPSTSRRKTIWFSLISLIIILASCISIGILFPFRTSLSAMTKRQ